MNAADTSGCPSNTSLTPYEILQIERISRWKSSKPSRLTVIVESITEPLVWVVGRCVPRSAVTTLVQSLETVAAKADGVAEVKRAAGVCSLDEMFGRSLEECDALAKRFCAHAERVAIVESAVSGIAGPFLHMPAQLLAALRSIARIGHCYGYPLDQEIDRALIIDILEISMIPDPEERLAVLERLHDALERHEMSQDGVTDYFARAGRNMIAEELVDMVPIVGHAVSFVFDSTFMHNVDDTARRIFKERWLIETGRLTAPVQPAAEPQRASSLTEVGLAIGQAVYTIAATAGFMGTLPLALAGKILFRRRGRGPLSRGASHGASAAIEDARTFHRAVRNGDMLTPFTDPADDGIAVAVQ